MPSWSLLIVKLALKREENCLSEVEAHLRKVFPGLTEIREEKVSNHFLAEAYSPHRNQYNSTKILLAVSKEFSQRDVNRILVITSVDLYVKGLNFVFGEAQCPGRTALISTYRLKPEFYGEANGELFKRRVRKEAVHELCHTFGLTHCPNPFCVMHFSNTINDTDMKEDEPCSYCKNKLEQNILTILS